MDTIFAETIPTSVWFDGLTVEERIRTGGSSSSPLFAANIDSPSTIRNLRSKKTGVRILNNVSLKVDPGELCLILGAPKHANSLLLREISSHKSNSQAQFSDLLSRSQLVFCSYEDLHYPYLTVRQTLDLALRWKLPRLNSKQRLDVTKELLSSVGMVHTLDTRVGDEFFRGISGGERRRLSLLEALIAGGSVNCFDNATRGLDSATAAKVLDVLRQVAAKYGPSFIMTLYQGSQDVYDKFDKVVVMFNGQQIYYGLAKEVESYFSRLGYHRSSSRQTTMELIDLILDTEISFDEKRGIIDPSMGGSIPHTVDQLSLAWRKSPEYAALQNATQADSTSTSKISSTTYRSNLLRQFRTCFIRNFTNNVKSWPFYAAQLVTMIFLAICIGTLFLRLKMDTMGSFSRGSVIFFALLLFTFIAVSEVKINFGNSLVITRQSCNYLFYRPWVDSLSDIIAEIPFKLAEELIFLVIFYFLVNMNGNAGNFFSFYLFLSITILVVDQFYHMISRLSPTVAVATSLSGLALLWLAMYATYVVQQSQIKVWFKYWLMYTDPLMYAFESLLSTQLHKQIMHCNTVIPSGTPMYDSIPYEQRMCAWQGASLGNDFVRGDDYLKEAFGYKYSHVWRNLGILFIFFVGFTVIELIGIELTIADRGLDSLKLVEYRRKEEQVEEEPSRLAISALDKASSSSSDEQTANGLLTATATAVPTTTYYWQDLSYFLANGSCLLQGISGYVKTGELVALMGASGAGKTTLLNALAGRYNQGSVVCGHMSTMGGVIGYVEQQEMFVEELTVREALEIYASLQQAHDSSAHIEQILRLLGLDRYSNFQLRGLPLEQRKKVSLGIELVNRPTLLFVDEITSGLDDLSAYNIVKCLQDLARNAHIAILCTVHQPSPSLIGKFDRLLLLKRDGQQTYYGGINSAVDFFSHHELRRCGENENIVDYMIELTGDESVDWQEYWRSSGQSTNLERMLEDEVEEVEKTDMRKATANFSYFHQFSIILRRTAIEVFRNKNYVFAKVGLYVFSGLFIGFSFWKVDYSIKSLQSSMFAIFLILCVCSPLIHQIQDRCNPAKLLYELREFRDYHWSILPLCQIIVEAPLAIVSASLSFLCFFFTWDINESSVRAGYFYLDYAIMFQLYYVTFAIGVLYFSPNELIGDVYSSLFFALMVVFCGAMQPYSMIPAFWKYTVYYESPFTYFLQNLMTDLFDNRPIVCQANEYALLSPQLGMNCQQYLQQYIDINGGYLKNGDETIYCTYCEYTSGQDFTKNLNMYFSNHWRNFGIMWIFVVANVVLMLMAYKAMLKYRGRGRGKGKKPQQAIEPSSQTDERKQFS